MYARFVTLRSQEKIKESDNPVISASKSAISNIDVRNLGPVSQKNLGLS